LKSREGVVHFVNRTLTYPLVVAAARWLGDDHLTILGALVNEEVGCRLGVLVGEQPVAWPAASEHPGLPADKDQPTIGESRTVVRLAKIGVVVDHERPPSFRDGLSAVDE